MLTTTAIDSARASSRRLFQDAAEEEEEHESHQDDEQHDEQQQEDSFPTSAPPPPSPRPRLPHHRAVSLDGRSFHMSDMRQSWPGPFSLHPPNGLPPGSPFGMGLQPRCSTPSSKEMQRSFSFHEVVADKPVCEKPIFVKENSGGSPHTRGGSPTKASAAAAELNAAAKWPQGTRVCAILLALVLAAQVALLFRTTGCHQQHSAPAPVSFAAVPNGQQLPLSEDAIKSTCARYVLAEKQKCDQETQRLLEQANRNSQKMAAKYAAQYAKAATIEHLARHAPASARRASAPVTNSAAPSRVTIPNGLPAIQPALIGQDVPESATESEGLEVAADPIAFGSSQEPEGAAPLLQLELELTLPVPQQPSATADVIVSNPSQLASKEKVSPAQTAQEEIGTANQDLQGEQDESRGSQPQDNLAQPASQAVQQQSPQPTATPQQPSLHVSSSSSPSSTSTAPAAPAAPAAPVRKWTTEEIAAALAERQARINEAMEKMRNPSVVHSAAGYQRQLQEERAKQEAAIAAGYVRAAPDARLVPPKQEHVVRVARSALPKEYLALIPSGPPPEEAAQASQQPPTAPGMPQRPVRPTPPLATPVDVAALKAAQQKLHQQQQEKQKQELQKLKEQSELRLKSMQHQEASAGAALAAAQAAQRLKREQEEQQQRMAAQQQQQQQQQ
jgi:hypothetical protein